MQLPKIKIGRPRAGLLYGLFFLIAAFFITEYQKQQEEVRLDNLPAAGETWSGTLIQAKDGDSLVLKREAEAVEVRIFGVDAPELNQEYGPEAKAGLEGLLSGQTVTVAGREYDDYGRLVADLTLPDGREVGPALVGAGQAWVYQYYCKEEKCSLWLELEAEARAARKGLWAGESPENPREWRERRRQNGN